MGAVHSEAAYVVFWSFFLLLEAGIVAENHEYYPLGELSVSRKIVALLLLFTLTACAVSPTGRKQLAFMPDAQMISMGVQSFEQMKTETPKVADAAITAYVQCIADAIIRLPEVQAYSNAWEVVVFDEETVNAFALPGSKIGVYKGLLKVAETADQVAAVMGHEVGHVLAQHGNERVSQNLAVGQTLSLLESWMSASNTAYREQAMGLLGLGSQVGILLPFSRTHESEADEIGQTLMAKAGFDPRESVTLWQNMGKGGGKAQPEFLSTHPSHDTRIEQLRSQTTATMPLYNAATKHSCTRPAIK